MKMTLKESPGFRAFALLLPCLLLQAGCTTKQPTVAVMQRLQGTWEADNKTSITFTGNSLHYQDSTNEWHEGTFTLPAGTNPQELRLTLTGSSLTNGPGALIRASMKIEDRTLTLAPSGSGEAEPPKTFASTTQNPITLYEFRKVQRQKKNTELPKSK
jgi:hypothetical protein